MIELLENFGRYIASKSGQRRDPETQVENFGRYIASEAGQRRRDPGTQIKTADSILTDSKKRRLIEGARELQRNFAVAAWAIRKHLDYVSTFTYQATNDDEDLNQELEGLMRWYDRPINCDTAGRHSLRRMIRLAEARRVIDGDMFFIKFNDGRLQAIESDRVQDPPVNRDRAIFGDNPWIHGVKVGAGGKLQAIQIYRRHSNGIYDPERQVPARNFLHLGYFDTFDQIRGVSPLASAISSFQDVLEVKDYALAKAKVTQLFALAITREMADMDDETETDGEYSVDFGKGPIKLEMDPGDSAEFLESRHPSTEFQQFMQVILMNALKSLDIPWSFYDESFTNFFGSKSALIQYLQSCRAKRADLQELLGRITGWRINLWLASGVLQLPRGMRVTDLKWEWIPAGVPWWDPAKEVRGDIEAINAGLRTRSEIRRERYGDDWRDVVKKLAQERQLLKEYGIPCDLKSVIDDETQQTDNEEDNDDENS